VIATPAERVYVVDDEPAVRKALWRLLRSAGIEVEAFGSAEDFLGALEAEPAGCAILDVAMPGLDGLSLQAALASRGIDLPVLFLTGRGDIPMSVRAMKSGASDFLTKPVDGKALVAAVRRALEKGRSAGQARREDSEVRRRVASLTPRQRDVLEGVVAGRLNKQIAADLGIAEKTVKIHRGQVMAKMAAASVAELVRLVDRAGIRRN
jgi:FixJ family two-component response regulator